MTVQIDIDEKVLAEMDANLSALRQDRETFLREGVLHLAARLKREAQVAAQYRAAYGKDPQTDEEIEEWADVQEWPDRKIEK